MRKSTVLLFLFFCGAFAAFAVEGREVRLAVSSVPNTAADAIGEFDLTRADALIFRTKGAPDVVMPYNGITEYASRNELTHHLGVAGTIAVSIVRKRQRGHFLTVSWKDEKGVMQMTEFEISKSMPRPMLALLRAKAPSARMLASEA